MDFDFALLLVVLTAVAGVIWLLDRVLLAGMRARRAAGARGDDCAARPKSVTHARATRCSEPVVGRIRALVLPGAVADPAVSLVRRRAVQDSVRLDDADPAGRRFHPRQQVRLRPAPAGSEHEDPRRRRAQARRRVRVPLSEEPERGLHQARDRPAGRRDHLPRQDLVREWQGDCGDRPRRLYRCAGTGSPDGRTRC